MLIIQLLSYMFSLLFQMSPIENVIPNLVEERVQTNIELRNKQDRSRDLFGVQLEVCESD